MAARLFLSVRICFTWFSFQLIKHTERLSVRVKTEEEQIKFALITLVAHLRLPLTRTSGRRLCLATTTTTSRH